MGVNSLPARLVLAGYTASAAELNVLDGVTAGTVIASKGVVVDANIHQDVINVTTLSIGTSGSATAVTATAAELNVLDAATAGTVVASKAIVVDASKNIGDFNNLDVVNLDAGASGTAGSIDVFPTTASKGKLTFSCTDQDADTTVEVKPAAMGQAAVISIPDPGAATANVMLTDQANNGFVITASYTELNVLDGVTAGTVAASSGVVVDANIHQDVVNVTTLSIGTSGSATAVTATAAELNQLDGNILNDLATTAGTGITSAATASCTSSVEKAGALYKTTIVIDMNGFHTSVTPGDIIGDTGAANCHIGQITAARNGTIFAGSITCLEAPSGGTDDIDLYTATEATGTEDAAITGLTAPAQLIDAGAHAALAFKSLSAFPAADSHLYLVAGGASAGDYTAGILVIELWGK